MRTRLSICRKKARYPSYEAALVVARSADIELRPSPCNQCRQYHLTGRLKGKWMPRER